MSWGNNRCRCLTLLAVSLWLTGCAHRDAPKAGRPDPLPLEEYPQIAVLEGLHRAVVVTDVKEEPGPPLWVQVAARNKTDDDERHVQYRFFFFNAVGEPESPNPDWHYVRMPARTLVYFQGNALDRSRTDWRLEIRPAR
jgi:hypothetical protein